MVTSSSCHVAWRCVQEIVDDLCEVYGEGGGTVWRTHMEIGMEVGSGKL